MPFSCATHAQPGRKITAPEAKPISLAPFGSAQRVQSHAAARDFITAVARAPASRQLEGLGRENYPKLFLRTAWQR